MEEARPILIILRHSDGSREVIRPVQDEQEGRDTVLTFNKQLKAEGKFPELFYYIRKYPC